MFAQVWVSHVHLKLQLIVRCEQIGATEDSRMMCSQPYDVFTAPTEDSRMMWQQQTKVHYVSCHGSWYDDSR